MSAVPVTATTDLVILCGGRGVRLGSLTAQTPKPLLPVAGRPFLLHLLLRMRQEGFTRTILAAHYLAEQFDAFLSTYAQLIPDVELVRESEPLGTGGALRHAAEHVRSQAFVALNGDSWLLQPVFPVLADHVQSGSALTMVVVKAGRVEGGARDKGMVSIGPHEEIRGFRTGEAQSDGWVNAGLYVLGTDRVRTWPTGRYDLEQRLFALVPPGQGRVFRSAQRLLDIGTRECYAVAERGLATSDAAALTPVG